MTFQFVEIFKSSFKISFIHIHSNIINWVLETDQIVTLGLFHFISPANGYTHTLHIHSAITKLK